MVSGSLHRRVFPQVSLFSRCCRVASKQFTVMNYICPVTASERRCHVSVWVCAHSPAAGSCPLTTLTPVSLQKTWAIKALLFVFPAIRSNGGSDVGWRTVRDGHAVFWGNIFVDLENFCQGFRDWWRDLHKVESWIGSATDFRFGKKWLA